VTDRLMTIVETPEYLRRARAVGMSDEDCAAVVGLLAADPAAGVALGGGLYKMRLARRGGGKKAGDGACCTSSATRRRRCSC
jgi:hypothetical protein